MSYYDDLRAGDEETIREWGRPVKLRGKADPIIAIFNEPQPDGIGLTNIFLEPHTSSENSEYSKY